MNQQNTPHIVIIGTGGLGGPCAIMIGGALGCRMTIVDPDRVELSNLQRQIQFDTGDIGIKKAQATRDRLLTMGLLPSNIIANDISFSRNNAASFANMADLLVETSDDVATKFLANDIAVQTHTPLVLGSVGRFGGQVFVYSPGDAHGCYRCLFESEPDTPIMTCAQAGILGATCGLVAAQMSRCATRLIKGQARPGLWILDDVRTNGKWRRITFHKRAGCPSCQTAVASAQPNGYN